MAKTPTKYVIFLRFWANELMNWNEAWNIAFNSHQDSLKLVLLRVLLYKKVKQGLAHKDSLYIFYIILEKDIMTKSLILS